MDEKIIWSIGFVLIVIILCLLKPIGVIQLPWLGIAGVQIFLLRKDFDKTFIEIISGRFRKSK